MATKTADNLELARRACSHLEKRYVQMRERPVTDCEPFNYHPFLDLLADDAVFAAPCTPGTPLFGSEFRGKQAIRKLFLEDDANLFENLRVEKQPEYFSNKGGDRIVVVTAYTYTIKRTGMVARDKDIALVLDFADGRITRAVEIQDMSEWVESCRA